jgi:hypothetical protein
MAISKIEREGGFAREVVRRKWPNATSTYVRVTSAEVYDPETKTVLGTSDADEFSVEHAWVDAANKLLLADSPAKPVL